MKIIDRNLEINNKFIKHKQECPLKRERESGTLISYFFLTINIIDHKTDVIQKKKQP